MAGYLFIAAFIVGIFAWHVAKRWWHENEWTRQRKRATMINAVRPFERIVGTLLAWVFKCLPDSA